MTASSSVVKLTARTALKNNWLKAIAACMSVISVFIIISGIASLVSFVGGDIAAYICEAVLGFLLLLPLCHGLIRFFGACSSVRTTARSRYFTFSRARQNISAQCIL